MKESEIKSATAPLNVEIEVSLKKKCKVRATEDGTTIKLWVAAALQYCLDHPDAISSSVKDDSVVSDLSENHLSNSKKKRALSKRVLKKR